MRHKYYFNLLAAGLSAGLIFTGCSKAAEGATSDGTDLGDGFAWREENYTTIQLEEGAALIESSGVYELTGDLGEGSLTIDVDKEADTGTVYLVLNGVTMNSATAAPIHINEAKQVVMLLEDGTVNTITQGNQVVTDESDNPSAAVFSKADLEITGNGTLNVTTEFNDGITSKDDLVISGGTITVNAASDGIVGKDLVSVDAAVITITAGKDGLRSTNAEEADKGNVVIGSGSLTINAADDGIHTENSLTVTQGTVTIENSYEGIEGKEITIEDGTISIVSTDDGVNVSSQTGTLTVNHGNITVKSGGDGLDSNGNIIQNGGNIVIDTSTIASMDTPVDYDGTFTQNGGTITDQNGSEIDTEQDHMGRGGQGGGQRQLPPDGSTGNGEKPKRGEMKNGNQGV